MKIAHVIVNLGKGGGQRSTIDLIRATSSLYDNYLILLENKRSYSPKDIKIYSLCEDKKNYKRLDVLGDYLLSKKLDSLLKNLEIDIVISHMEVTAKVIRFINLPKIFYMRVDITQELESIKKKSKIRFLKREKLYRKLFDNQNLITISQDTEKNLRKYINPKNIQTIYNPFDIEKIRKLSNEKFDFFERDYIIQIGSGIKRKRQDVLLEAFSKIDNKEVNLLLLGTEKNSEIVKIIDKFNINQNRIFFIPFAENPYPFIKNAKLLVMSSEREGLPRVIVESLILNTPVVSTDCDTGPKEILEGEFSSFLSVVGDSDQMAKNIDRALENYPRIDDSFIEKFDKNIIKKKYVNYINKVLNESTIE